MVVGAGLVPARPLGQAGQGQALPLQSHPAPLDCDICSMLHIHPMGSGYISYSAAVILQALANGYIYGFDIMDATGLPSGTVYPSLRRLEQAELVISRWEEHSTAQRELRPPRKYYELTPDGDAARAEALTRYRLLERLSPATN